jgi:transcription factor SPN1
MTEQTATNINSSDSFSALGTNNENATINTDAELKSVQKELYAHIEPQNNATEQDNDLQIQLENNTSHKSLVEQHTTSTSEPSSATETKGEDDLAFFEKNYENDKTQSDNNNNSNSASIKNYGNLLRIDKRENASEQVDIPPQKHENESSDPNLSGLYSKIFGDSDDEESDFDLEKVGDMESLSELADEDDENDLEQKNQKNLKLMTKIENKRHKKRKKEDSDEAETELSEEQTTKRPKSESSKSVKERPPSIDAELEQQFQTEVLEKTKRRRRIKYTDEEIARESMEIVEKMQRAYLDDLRAFKAKEPAIHKLSLLPEAITQLSKVHLQESLLDNKVLNVMRQWLEPLPDGALPNVKIREGFLKILTKYRIGKHYLSESGIAKAVMFLSQHPQETQSNKRLATQLLNDWARPLFGISENYSELNNNDLQVLQSPAKKFPTSPGGMTSPTKNVTENILDADLETNQPQPQQQQPHSQQPQILPKIRRLHATIPEKSPMDYIVRPVVKMNTTPKKASTKTSAKKSRFEKLFQVVKEGHKKQRQRAVSVSVTKGVIV